jgi:two-component system NtrC family sensor kinase
MVILMILITVIPLCLMAFLNYHQCQKALKGQIVDPLRVLINKTKHSFELFLAERRSAVSFIASAYSYENLADQKTLNRIFQVMKREFGGFVDLGLIDSAGLQVSYSGPYHLKGKNYKDQEWFHEVKVRGTHISDVFMGYRRYPHFVIAVQQLRPTGESWIVRATIDTDKFNSLIYSMGLEPESDAFVLNQARAFQTPSKFYGRVLEKSPLPFPMASVEANVFETVDSKGRQILVGYSDLISAPFTLAVVKPRAKFLKSWCTLKNELFIIFVASVVAIFLVVYKLTDSMVKRIEDSDKRQRQALHEIEHTSKLASIGRLAAGVAHEINNPMAVIDQKAGLMTDLMESIPQFPKKEKFLDLAGSISDSVDRCRTITHRLLGFARRMDVEIAPVNLNEVIQEVLGFLEKEASHRNIDLRLNLAEDLPRIASDRGQLQQVFLNILNNSFAAVEDGGNVTVTSWEHDLDTVGVAISDSGCGMSEETIKHIFEPFFTTKKGYGTGLGLSITYGIVKRLGGDIQVQSQEGQGATFTVFLPKKGKGAEG